VPFSVHVSMRYTVFAAGVMIIANTISSLVISREKQPPRGPGGAGWGPPTELLVTKRLLLNLNPR
jgi:hypothetical protein